ncbi:MAG: hypothetical protein FH758_03790 [Firmicutes bacterium]|nr:hypothetical protein [Bacillota bacterium]
MLDWEVIYQYTRKQTLEDGVLIDVSNTAKEAGFRYPIAVTKAVWEDIITPDFKSRDCGQSEEGRLWDILQMCLLAARTCSEPELRFQVLVVFNGHQKKIVTLKAICHPGDDMEPVVTIMLPNED